MLGRALRGTGLAVSAAAAAGVATVWTYAPPPPHELAAGWEPPPLPRALDAVEPRAIRPTHCPATTPSEVAHTKWAALQDAPACLLQRVRQQYVVQLRDGRHLAVAEYGDPDGAPVLYLHSGGGSRLELAAFGDVLPLNGHACPLADSLDLEAMGRQPGLRVIAMDRPGYGLSDAVESEHELVETVTMDVLELADKLGLERFAVMGISVGGLYATACAAHLPNLAPGRLRSATALGGVVPGKEAVSSPIVRALMDTAPGRAVTATALRAFRMFAWEATPATWAKVRAALSPLVRKAGTSKSPLDEALEAILDQSRLVANTREALRHGTQGLMQDMRVCWGFAPFPVQPQEVDGWLGLADAPSVPDHGAAPPGAPRSDSTDASTAVPPLQRARTCGEVSIVEHVSAATAQRWACLSRARGKQGLGSFEGLSPDSPRLHFWHGTLDPVVPFAQAQELATSLKGSILHEMHGKGHLSSIVTAAWAGCMRAVESDLNVVQPAER